MKPAPLRIDLPGIASRIRAASRVLVFLDFDGTLVRIMDRPERCALDPGVRSMLSALVRDERVGVGIVSGRNLADVRSRVRVDGIAYAGNHGLEIEGPGFCFVEPNATTGQAALRQITHVLEGAIAAYTGAWLEDKGFSVSIHYRQVATAAVRPLREAVHAVVSSMPDARKVILREGKKVLEIRPDVDWDKGRAVAWMAARMTGDGPGSPMFYFGDDDTDEDVFRRFRSDITVHVGSAISTSARYTVRDVDGVHAALRWILQVLDRSSH